MNLDLILGFFQLIPFLGGVLARLLRFPMITGYLVIGMVLSPSVTGIISEETISGLTDVVTPVALGLIAYLIGGNLNISSLSGLKKAIALVSASEAAFAWVFTALLMMVAAPLLIGGSTGIGPQGFLFMGIVAGAVSLATAPVGTVSITREYRARGPLTSTLLGVVALDNSLAIIAYAVAVALVNLVLGVSGTSVWQGVGQAVVKIAGSWALGAGFALLLRYLAWLAKRKGELSLVVVGTVIFCDGAAQLAGLSGLMATLALGIAAANLPGRSQHLFEVLDDLEEIVYALFLTLVGTHLNPGLLQTAGLLAVLIVMGRMGGKYVGARLGATMAGAPVVVRRYLGLTLLAKAGLTVGLVLLIKRDLAFAEATAELLVNGILASTIINQLIAPPLVRLALIRSGEAGATTEVAPEPPPDPMRYITVGEAMTKGFPTAPETMSIVELVALFERTGHHGFPVVDSKGHLSGIVALSDVPQASLEGNLPATVGDIATKEVITAFPEQTLREALRWFDAREIGRLPVVDRADPKRLLGVLRRRDIVSAYARALPQRQQERPSPTASAFLPSSHVLVVEIGSASLVEGTPISQLPLPKDCLIISINRHGGLIIPRGDTVLRAGDQVTVLTTLATRSRVAQLLK